MGRSILAACLALALWAQGMPAVASSNPFTGAWEATDVDGSHMILAVSGGDASVRATVFDDYATLCARHGAPGGAVIPGTGIIANGDLTFTFARVICRQGVVLRGGSQVFVYKPASDTLFGMDVAWHRL